jgi:hypothetical protein
MQMSWWMARLPTEGVYNIALQQPTFEGYRNAFYMARKQPIVNDRVADKYTVQHVQRNYSSNYGLNISIYYTFGGEGHRGNGLPATIIQNANRTIKILHFMERGQWMGTASSDARVYPNIDSDVDYEFKGPVFNEAFERYTRIDDDDLYTIVLYMAQGDIIDVSFSRDIEKIDPMDDIPWLAQYFRPYMDMLDTDDFARFSDRFLTW